MLFRSSLKFNDRSSFGASLVAQTVKNLPAMQGTQDEALDWGRSTGEGNGNSLQYSCLENFMYREAWWATIHGVAKSWA